MQISDKDPKHFKETCLSFVNTIAPLKNKFVRANQTPFINKEIQQAVTMRSKLRKNTSKVTPKVTRKHTVSNEINALVY